MRLFVAIDLPGRVRERLAGLAGGVPGARWVGADGLHLTLRFIGEADGARYEDIVTALGQVRVPPFSMRLEGVGSFGNGRKARVIWAGVTADETLDRLQAKVETALVRTGLPPEHRKFHPHITLARLKSADPGRLAAFLAHHDGFVSEDIAVDHFTLYSSHLGSGGATYRIEERYPLDG